MKTQDTEVHYKNGYTILSNPSLWVKERYDYSERGLRRAYEAGESEDRFFQKAESSG